MGVCAPPIVPMLRVFWTRCVLSAAGDLISTPLKPFGQKIQKSTQRC